MPHVQVEDITVDTGVVESPTVTEEEASSATGTTAASAVATPAYRRTSGDGA